MPRDRRFRLASTLVSLVVSVLLAFSGPAQAAKKKGEARLSDAELPAKLAEARELLEADRPGEAEAVLDRVLDQRPKTAEALLLRSTARIMLGELDRGRADLERSLELDGLQRQGWLNLGAMEIAEQRWDRALEAFEAAEALDPEAPENDLNIGAVLLLQGKLEAASGRFASYLGGGASDSAQGYYLVATNYALAGYAALAVEHLEEAIGLDERIRLQVRTDPNFTALRERPELQRLLTTDSWRPVPGSYTASRTFGAPYQAGDGRLLKAVLDTLQLASVPFDSRVEVTSEWALIWGEMRIKVTHGPEGQGRVEVSAEADRFTPAEWRDRLQLLFEGIQHRLVMMDLRQTRPG